MLYEKVSGNSVASIRSAGVRALRPIDVGSVVVALVLLAALALARRHVARAAVAIAVVVSSVGSTELLKHGLPHLRHALPPARPPSFPSGHTSVAVSLGLALVLAAPPLLRPSAALLGAAYGAGVGLAVIVLGAHYPSDVVGSFFVCGAWASVAAFVLRGPPARPSLSPAGLLLALAVVGAALVLAAVLAERHPAGVAAARSAHAVVGTAAMLGFLSVVLFGAYAALLGQRDA